MQVLRDISHLPVAPLFGRKTKKKEKDRRKKKIFGITGRRKRGERKERVNRRGDKLRR